jgi:hypothetical protein
MQLVAIRAKEAAIEAKEEAMRPRAKQTRVSSTLTDHAVLVDAWTSPLDAAEHNSATVGTSPVHFHFAQELNSDVYPDSGELDAQAGTELELLRQCRNSSGEVVASQCMDLFTRHSKGQLPQWTVSAAPFARTNLRIGEVFVGQHGPKEDGAYRPVG